MKKRILAFLFTIILVITVLPTYAFAAGSLSNFTKARTYPGGKFSDVSNEWFAPSVQTAFEYGLMDGTTVSTFSPNKNLTIAEALKLAACLNSIYNTGSADFTPGTPWYQPYVDYALQNGIISAPYANYTAYATRSDFALIFAKALPDEALTAINTIDDNAIPDVPIGYTYGPAVYKLYRAGVLTGSDSTGTFYPNINITRDAVASIVTRMANICRQPLLLLSKELPATEIATKCSPAVFYLELFGKTGKAIGSASGFFISSNGLAITNYHVINGVSSAKITMKDGKIYDVAGVVDYNEASDLALIQINGTGFSYLQLGDSGTAVTGANIYAIGYPLGVGQTVTPGSITNASHSENGVDYIMFNASISHGNSGGALINSYGQVIGVTGLTYEAGQNLNEAVPINMLSSLSQKKDPVSLASIYAANYAYSFYSNYSTIPDFGSLFKIQPYSQHYDPQYREQDYFYSSTSLSDLVAVSAAKYIQLLISEGFTYDSYDDDGFLYFIDSNNTMEVAVGPTTLNGVDCVEIAIFPV